MSIERFAPDYCDCPKCANANRGKAMIVQVVARLAMQLGAPDRDLASCMVEVLLAALMGKCENKEEYLDFVKRYFEKYILPFAENVVDHLIAENTHYRANKNKIDADVKARMQNGVENDGLVVNVRFMDEESGKEFTSTRKH